MKGLLSLILLLAVTQISANSSIDECLLETLKRSAPDATVKHLYLACQTLAQDPSPADLVSASTIEESSLERRIRIESSTRDKRFVITPHRINYLLPLSYNDSPNSVPFFSKDRKIDNTEIKFQLSFKAPLTYNLLGSQGDLYLAYTNQS